MVWDQLRLPDAAGRRRLAVAAGAAIVLVAASAVLLGLRAGGPDVSSIVDLAGNLLAGAASAVLAGRRALQEEDPRARLGWRLMSVCCGLFATGVVIAAFYVALDVSLPFPSAADPIFLAGAALMVPAVPLIGGRLWVGSLLRLTLDGAIIVGAILLASWLAGLRTTCSHVSGPACALRIAYPIGDIVYVVVVLSILSHARRLDPAVVGVGVAMLAFSFSDSLFAYVGYQRPNVIDVGYMVGYLLIGLTAAVGWSTDDIGPKADLARWQVLLPYLPLAFDGALLVTEIIRRGTLDVVSQLATGVLVTGVLVRQLMAVLEAQALAAEIGMNSANLEVLVDQAPIGICWVDSERRMVRVNTAMASMLGYTKQELTGLSILDINPPEDHPRTLAAHTAFMTGSRDLYMSERRWLRKDRSLVWCWLRVAPVRPRPGAFPESLIAIAEDVTDVRRQAQRAANIQRQLLPREVPAIDGYDLAGGCRPAQDVAGDLYDWVLREDGHLDLTVADVMGKGVAAALVMATLRAALRTAPSGLAPASRVRAAADSLALGGVDEGMFVTLFHCRLDPATGVLRYVDAGHGYSVIRRQNGDFVGLSAPSLPLGVDSSDPIVESTARLEPGDTLVLYSDGLVETEERTVDVAEFADEIERPEDAAGVVTEVMGRMPEKLSDDVTVVVLRRLPDGSVGRGRVSAVRPVPTAGSRSSPRPSPTPA